MEFEMVCISDTGAVRAHNEDNFCFHGEYMPMEHQSSGAVKKYTGTTDQHPAAALFDGMGGECLGEQASYEAALAFAHYLNERDMSLDYSHQEISRQLHHLNDVVVKQRTRARVKRMGTTVSVLALNKEHFWVGNLGDSPVYLIRNYGIRLLSQVHTNKDFLKRIGNVGQKPGLTQFLGVSKEEFLIEPYVCREKMQNRDCFLLCSDGLTDMVSQGEMMEILLRGYSLEEIALELKDAALQNGGHDNITVILCKVYL